MRVVLYIFIGAMFIAFFSAGATITRQVRITVAGESKQAKLKHCWDVK